MNQLKIIISVLLALTLGYSREQARVECIAGCGDTSLGTPAQRARLIEPFAVALDRDRNGFICEYKGQRISRLTADGALQPWAGTGEKSYGGDGGPASKATFNDPHGLVISKQQQMYVADTLNHRVRKIDLKTGIISTVAGTGEAGFGGDGETADRAAFNGIYALDLNRAGTKLYVADLANRRVRVIDLKSGIVKTAAGNGLSAIPEDGAEAASSPLVDPRAVALDSAEKLYILERRGNALRVVDTQGRIRTLIGPEVRDSPSKDVRLNGPKHLWVDSKDNVIIADSESHVIRKYTPKDGKTITIAGTGEKGAKLVSEDPLKTQLDRPHGVYVSAAGALYVSDSYNHRILKITGW